MSLYATRDTSYVVYMVAYSLHITQLAFYLWIVCNFVVNDRKVCNQIVCFSLICFLLRFITFFLLEELGKPKIFS